MRRAFVLMGTLVVVLGLAGVLTIRRAEVEVPPGAVHAVTPVSADELRAKARVILVTLDGARWQDVLDRSGRLGTTTAMPKTLELVRQSGVALPASISSKIPLSLPGYQALLAGRQTPCDDNDCARVSVETVSERLSHVLELPADQIATFASWAKLAFAATSKDDVGRVLVDAPPLRLPSSQGPPWENARWDEETISKALSHWKTAKPRFLHLALLDMDERAHRGDVDGTLQALQRADEAIAELWTSIQALPEPERALTTILVTADHGRGPGGLWKSHAAYSASRDVFVLAIGALVKGGTGSATQADVRPTLERLVGICPLPSEGSAIAPIVGELPCS